MGGIASGPAASGLGIVDGHDAYPGEQKVTSSERMEGSMVSGQPDLKGQGGVTIL
ncbi:hypothetical protein NKH82_25250 [Mesorhizobium sp. M0915]|uniref:hypothetical protein n=1 Tax=unclassified Mesorhizobium TaxID=325217 RepID=UPI0003FFC982|nr:hypothetical protein [Mesorhizobium sp. LSHC420B00]